MTSVVGVRFKQAGRVYYFDPAGLEFHVGEWVVVDSPRGPALAQVVIAPDQVISSGITEPLKPVTRKATQEDIEQASDIRLREREALAKCGELAREMNLPMKVIAADCDLEANHVTIFFRSEERVDFRELVKRLGGVLKMRVELRQTGPRDGAKLIGGMGRCGRPLCCATFLTELAPVSIKMAKEQSLPLNPTKISGVCGRLLCCLNYEVDFYRSIREKMPAPGQKVSTSLGEVTVVETSPLRETVLVETESGATAELSLEQVRPPAQPAARRAAGEEPGVEGKPSAGEKPAAQQGPQRRRRRPRRKRKGAATPAGEAPQRPPAQSS
ncbi:MAG: stage 0 sporulation family protein [Chloroflexota bacterium]